MRKTMKVNLNITGKCMYNMEEQMTTIKVSMKNRDAIAKATKYGESLNDGLTRIIKNTRLQEGKGE